MSSEEWDDLPWWESELLVDGFREEGIIGDGDNNQSVPGAPGKPTQSPLVDLTRAGPVAVGGFTTRRAG